MVHSLADKIVFRIFEVEWPGGREVSKNHIRLEAYGTVDELNAVLGIVRTENRLADSDKSKQERLETMLHRIQNDLFNVGSDLATLPADRWEGMVTVGGSDVELSLIHI